MSDENIPNASGVYPVNLTRAGVTGKVMHRAPNAAKTGPSSGKTRGGKMSAHRKRHVKGLMRQGLISQKAAARNGLAR